MFDLYPDSEVLGGAPLNFAVHANRLASRLGKSAAPVSRIGLDARGERIKEQLADLGVTAEFLQTDAGHATGTVDVTIDGAGQPSYIVTENAAWDFLQFTSGMEELAASCEAVCFGTLAQRRDGAREAIEAFLTAVPKAIRLFDVNLRQDYYDLSMLRRGCALATDLKLNEGELDVLAEMLELRGNRHGDYILALFDRFPLDRVLLTRGAKGCVLFGANNTRFEGKPVSYPPAPGADAVGAGDAAAAGFTIGLLAEMHGARIVELANEMGAWVASQPGATPGLPDRILDSVTESRRAHP